MIREDLEKVVLFQDLSAAQLNEVASFCHPLSLHDGDMLIRESDRDNRDLFVLCSGSVEIVSNDTRLVSGEIVISKEQRDVFGEISWLTKNPRTASVRCHGDVNAIRIDGEGLMAFLDKHKDIGYVVMRRVALVMSQRMQSADGLLKQILWNTNL